MNLLRKIKNCKRHRANRRIVKLADSYYFAATEVYLDKPSLKIVVGQRTYNIIYFRNGFVPFNIINGGWLFPNDEFIITEKDTSYLENPPSFDDWYKMYRSGLSKEGQEQLNNIPMSRFAQPELYLHIEKPIPITTSLSVKEN